ncbi:HpcH/HpaI aldolase/citrate lyase family protein [Xanthobacter wiegelii]|uniref:HpcH/HpaI aldolase/citrate lyase family protein n=1 Tax=Xanthobacter wiegelii TaxID=3119913 RepID=UPI00372D48B9
MMGALDFVVPLFVPGHRPDRFGKAAASGTDAVIIDLEDAVPPDAKAGARDALTADLAIPVMVRVNGMGTPWHTEDLVAVARLCPAAAVLPKAEDPAILDAVAATLGPAIPIVALIETARGLAAARAIAAHPAVVRIVFGSIDFCADLGCAHVREALLLARAELVLAARLAGGPAPVDGVTTGIDDEALIADDARHARGLGFSGKLAIHPRQIEAIRSGFLPDAAEIAWAKRILASGEGATAVDGAMVDEPVRIRARMILATIGSPRLL